MTYSRSALPPNDWVAYYNWRTGEVLHIGAFYNPARSKVREDMPPRYEDFEIE